MKRALLLALGAACGLASADCMTKACTLMGCDSGATVQTSATLPVATPDLSKLVFTVCRNDVCDRGQPTLRRDPCAAGVQGCHVTVDLRLEGPLLASVGWQPHGAADVTGDTERFDAYDVSSFSVTALGNAERDALRDGDTYSLTIAWGDGSAPPPVSITKTATTYDKRWPNGEDCDGENGYCRYASIQ